MLDPFKLIDGDTVILRSKGVFTVNDVYVRQNELFAKRGSGFIRLKGNNATSVPGVMWEQIETAHSVNTLNNLTL